MTSSRRLVTCAVKFVMLASESFSAIIAIFCLHTKKVSRFTRTEQRAPDNTEVQRSPPNFWSLEWNLLPTPKIWIWLPYLWKICGPLDEKMCKGPWPNLRIQLEKVMKIITIIIQDSRFQGPAYNPVPAE
jgi:hypothetical protein